METQAAAKSSAKSAPTSEKLQSSKKLESHKGMGAGTKVILSTVIGIPVVLLTGMK